MMDALFSKCGSGLAPLLVGLGSLGGIIGDIIRSKSSDRHSTTYVCAGRMKDTTNLVKELFANRAPTLLLSTFLNTNGSNTLAICKVGFTEIVMGLVIRTKKKCRSFS